MSIFSGLKSIFSYAKEKALQRRRIIDYGVLFINKYWFQNHEFIKDFPPEFVEKQGEIIWKELDEIANSPNPFMANREKLSSWLCEATRFMVIVAINPPPDEDTSGLRGQLGITGELQSHLLELYKVSQGFREGLLRGFSGAKPQNYDDVWDMALAHYRSAISAAQIFMGLRVAFDDYNKDVEQDWYRPFLAAMCSQWERIYRNELGIPSAFDKTYGIESLLLALFQKHVEEGARYPDLEWQNAITDIEKGDAWRANSWLEKSDVVRKRMIGFRSQYENLT